MAKRIWIGGLFLFIGIGILLHQMNIWDFPYVLRTWWPLLLIAIGVYQLARRENSSPVASLMIIIIGGLFLLNQWTDINLTAFIWPLIFIFIGLMIIFSHFKLRKITEFNHTIESFSLFSGADLRSQSNNFKGGEVVAVFGGAEIDLRDAIISEEGATFDFITIFGGINMAVPENVRVEISGLPILGGWENKTRRVAKSNDAPMIKINCIAIFGGVEVKD